MDGGAIGRPTSAPFSSAARTPSIVRVPVLSSPAGIDTMRIDGRVFIVTGASSGIGLAAARALAARGGKVALIARSTQALADLAASLPGSLAITADMTDFGAVRRAVAEID